MAGRAIVAAILTLLAVVSAFCQTSNVVTISRTVIDDSGLPVAGALVHYNNSLATEKDALGHPFLVGQFVSSHVLTGKDGSFSITGVPPAIYLLNAAGVAGTQLRSCDWGQRSTRLDLTTITTATNVRLQVTNGVLVTFQVNDPRGQIRDYQAALAANVAGEPQGNFRIFVHDGSTFMAAAIPVSVSGAVRQYAVAVPKMRTLYLYLDTLLTVEDQSRTPIPTRVAANKITVNGQTVTLQLSVP